MAILLAVLCAPVRAAPLLDLSRVDTAAHLGISYALNLTGTAVLAKYEVPRWKAVCYASAGTAALGILKELLDSQFDVTDLTADVLGTGVAVGVVYSFDLF